MSDLRVVVIGKNEGITLDRVFRSINVAKQNFEKAFGRTPEVVYVDSNSTDDSVEIAKNHNVRTIIIKDKPNPAKARNAGLQDCITEFIFFLDGDTEVDPMWLVEGVRYLQMRTEVAGVGGMLKNIFYAPDNSPKFIIENYRNIVNEEEPISDSMGGTFLFRVAALKKVNGFNAELRVSEEFELMLRLLYHNLMVRRIKKPMATHHDYKTKATLSSYFKKNIFTPDIFVPGFVIVNVPKNFNVLKKIFQRYGLYFIYLPLLLFALFLFSISEIVAGLIVLVVLVFLVLYYKDARRI